MQRPDPPLKDGPLVPPKRHVAAGVEELELREAASAPLLRLRGARADAT